MHSMNIPNYCPMLTQATVAITQGLTAVSASQGILLKYQSTSGNRKHKTKTETIFFITQLRHLKKKTLASFLLLSGSQPVGYPPTPGKLLSPKIFTL